MILHVFLFTVTNKAEHMSPSSCPPHSSLKIKLFFPICFAFLYSPCLGVKRQYVRFKMQSGVSACCLSLIQVFKWHEKRQPPLRGVTSVCLWRKKHLQIHPAFLPRQERKRKQRLGKGRVSLWKYINL